MGSSVTSWVIERSSLGFPCDADDLDPVGHILTERSLVDRPVEAFVMGAGARSGSARRRGYRSLSLSATSGVRRLPAHPTEG